jgi:hypothetical protein
MASETAKRNQLQRLALNYTLGQIEVAALAKHRIVPVYDPTTDTQTDAPLPKVRNHLGLVMAALATS